MFFRGDLQTTIADSLDFEMISLQVDSCMSELTGRNADSSPFRNNAFEKRQLSVPTTESHQKRQLCVCNARDRWDA